ncbi:hypothetical protein TNIN_325451 [Trichonephila inaurata madagascariensis]|uniref:Uncharacterized protein n=1 Tax=Trichonephila inaurata madagascariensis TaxID=2747483 RepID=A0A8X7CMF6_9ARAC|nr:hypothetical protein TNIN_325451 [Trichonephila inaurata madagascariensis]
MEERKARVISINPCSEQVKGEEEDPATGLPPLTTFTPAINLRRLKKQAAADSTKQRGRFARYYPSMKYLDGLFGCLLLLMKDFIFASIPKIIKTQCME